jgi:hypothetical protein
MEAITIGDNVVLGAKNCYEHELAVETYAMQDGQHKEVEARRLSCRPFCA